MAISSIDYKIELIERKDDHDVGTGLR